MSAAEARNADERWAILGLGNPGKKYASTRHNVGFWVVEKLAGAATFRDEEQCRIARMEISGSDCLLILPQQFMNLSGQAAVPIVRYHKVPVERVIVVYDEIDLPPGALQVRQGGSGGGHRGVEDVITHIGSTNFYRIRVGIGHPFRSANNTDLTQERPQEQRLQDVGDWVLSKPGPQEKELLEATVSAAVSAIQILIGEGLKTAQNRFNRKSQS